MQGTIDKLRRAIEAIGHWSDCDARLKSDDYPVEELCDCPFPGALAALATLEREHAERERRLRENVLKILDNGMYTDHHGRGVLYDTQYVNFAHDQLAEILDSSTINDAQTPDSFAAFESKVKLLSFLRSFDHQLSLDGVDSSCLSRRLLNEVLSGANSGSATHD